ncbi:MAG: CbiX/SirB N-terminal domain-containing protein [Burkholderiales bacterium]|nr:CbiX/SirB N-terminal domain-containing protein [Burkholderiales bacterium]
MSTAIILFAHGARDPEWARPFERLRDAVAARAPGAQVRLAFLEFMSPDLDGAIAAAVAAGATALDVVPVFMAQGGHLKRDLPRMLDAARARHPALRLTLRGAVGEADAVIEAMARHIAGA